MEKLTNKEFLSEMADHGLPLLYGEEIEKRLDKGQAASDAMEKIFDVVFNCTEGQTFGELRRIQIKKIADIWRQYRMMLQICMEKNNIK